MSVIIEVEGERFRVDTRGEPRGRQTVDFTWLNGPRGGSYGFTVGATSAVPGGLTRAQIEQEAARFVRAFFSEGGIGSSDFPDFLAECRASGR